MRIHRTQSRLIQIAVLLAVLIFLSGVVKGSSWGGPANSSNGINETGSKKTLTNTKIVALGDSFTLGYPLGADKSWTATLADKLQVEVVNKGKVTQTGQDLLDRFDNDVLTEKPGRVIIFAGTGDALKNISLSDFQGYIKSLAEKSSANNIIPILALPVWYPGYEKTIESMREWERSYALSQNIMVLDFNASLFDSDKEYLTGLSTDGKYPNAKGYQVMGEYAATVLK
ncbi:MAG TPA: GDSL-type esterase/lipase family protein [Desulfitobacteriaceae bacterium]|nr:GDSL-type esterase/lipase family protein [Desulfitobacteriaceae bacterium]